MAPNCQYSIKGGREVPDSHGKPKHAESAQQAKIYQHEGNEQEMYRLLFRHATLVLRHLSIHPDSRQPNYRLALLQANKDVEFSLANLEILKPRLNKRYETYTQLLKDQDARLTSTVTSVNDDCSHLNGLDIKPPSHPDPVIRNSPACLISGDTKDLTVILAQSDTRKWAPAKANASHGTVSKEEELEYMEDHRPSHRDGVSSISQQGLDQQSLGLKPLTTSLRVKVDGSNRLENKASRLPYEYTKSSFSYPEVHRQNATENAAGKVRPEILEDNWPLEISTKTQPPERPPKAEIFSASGNEISPKLQYETVWDREDIVRTMTPFSPSLHLGTPNFTFKYSASLENGALLRTVFLPPSLRLRFLSLALPNTEANLETCGILCGTLISNALFISKLVIPDQESTSDTCETINEDKLFDYVDGEDLMVLGWIHTHPTQTCFMSSRDLHTHAGYQAMMPESIAIVCAPSKGEYVRFLAFLQFNANSN